MKKSILILILVLAFSICIFTGCQNNEQQTLPAIETKEPIQTIDESVEEVPEPAVPEETTAAETSEPVLPNDPLVEASPEVSTPAQEPISIPDYYYMGNRYGMGDFPGSSTLFEDPDGLSRLKQYYEALYQVVDRVEFHTQSLEFLGPYTGDMKFSANGEANTYGDGNYHTQLQTFMIGRYMYSFLTDSIEFGSNFSEEAFTVYSATDSIPIILGYEYMEVYNLGEELTLSLHTQPLNFVVIGFLKESTTFNFGANTILLDQKIIVPFYDIAYEPTDDVNRGYQQIYYLQKCEGYICIDASENEEETFNAVLALAEKYDVLFAVTPKKVELVPGL